MITHRYRLLPLALGLSFHLFGQGVTKDTTFLFKDTSDGVIQSIFIDGNRGSKFYGEVSDFAFHFSNNDSYQHSFKYLQKHKITLTKSPSVLPWKNWVTLKQYKGQYYAYHPCDFLFHFRQSVNDTTFIDWTGEGPIANKIIGQKKVDSKTYAFTLTGIYNQSRKLIVHIIDPKKGIAVFEQIVDDETEAHYYLMIAADKIQSVPIIVNHCPVQKQIELQFEEPDFKKLLKVNE